jgi:hypothetical protein
VRLCHGAGKRKKEGKIHKADGSKCRQRMMKIIRNKI